MFNNSVDLFCKIWYNAQYRDLHNPIKKVEVETMKKLLAICLAGVMTLGLVACGSKEPAASTDAPAASTDAPAAENSAKEEGAKVVVFWYDESDVYLGTVRDAMNKEFETLGITP